MSPNSDTVSLYALELSPNIGPDRWQNSRPQPVLITVHVHTSLLAAGASDNVADSIHYGRLSDAIFALQSPTRSFPSLVLLAEAAADVALSPQFPAVEEVHILAEAPKLLLQAGSLSVELLRSPARPHRLTMHINELSLETIIGVNPPERMHKQLVVTTLSFHDPQLSVHLPHRTIVDRLAEHIQSTAFLTLEAFATSVARVACFLDGMDRVSIKAQKPSAVLFGRSSGIQLTRDRAFFQRGTPSTSSSS